MNSATSYSITLGYFPQLLGLVYLMAFVSLLVQRLLEGSPAVLRLFCTIPFSSTPPDYIRLVVYRYHITDRATKRWWNRTEIGKSEPITFNR